MTDLDADVDDMDEEKWEDGEVEKGLDLKDVQMGEANGTHLEHPAFRVGEEEHPARTSSRILSVQNGQGPSPSLSNFVSYVSKSTDQAVGSNTPTNLAYRRNASRTNTQSFTGDPTASGFNTIGRGGPSFLSYARPATPIQSLPRDDETTPDGSPSAGGELLATDGPMTPTNHAGPFVFDGSGGRRTGLSPASDGGSSE